METKDKKVARLLKRPSSVTGAPWFLQLMRKRSSWPRTRPRRPARAFSPVCFSDQLTLQGGIVPEHRCTIAHARIGPYQAIATMHLVIYFLDLGLALAALFGQVPTVVWHGMPLDEVAGSLAELCL